MRMEWNETFQTHCDPSAPQEIFEPHSGNFGWLDYAHNIMIFFYYDMKLLTFNFLKCSAKSTIAT